MPSNTCACSVKNTKFCAIQNKLQRFASVKDTLVFQIVNEWLHNRAIMGQSFDLITSEESVITSELAKSKSILETSKTIGRYL